MRNSRMPIAKCVKAGHPPKAAFGTLNVRRVPMGTPSIESSSRLTSAFLSSCRGSSHFRWDEGHGPCEESSPSEFDMYLRRAQRKHDPASSSYERDQLSDSR
jgi:hypothetical protein